MASDTYIKFEGVDGEATQELHKGWVEILSWAWNISADTSFMKGTGAAVGKPVPGELSITHAYDKASPVLAKKIVTGTHFPTVTLVACKQGEGQKDFLTVTMKECFITSLAPSGGSGGDIVESATLVFKYIDFAYKPQDSKGALGADIKFGWDIAAMKLV